jgi:hypothetical protein
VRLEGLGKLKNINDLIGTRTRDIPVCSIVPQPSTLPRPSRVKSKGSIKYIQEKNNVENIICLNCTVLHACAQNTISVAKAKVEK